MQLEQEAKFTEACNAINNISSEAKSQLTHSVLRIYAIGIEKRHLKTLYHHNEISEAVYRRLQGKLQLQLEAVEMGNLTSDVSLHVDEKDIFEHMATRLRKLYKRDSEIERVSTQYMYYRAQVILSRKVIKELATFDQEYANHIFTSEAYRHTIDLYENFKAQSQKKMDAVSIAYPQISASLSEELASRRVEKIEELVLHELFEKELINQKLYITIRNELTGKH